MLVKPNHRKLILNLRDPTTVSNLIPTTKLLPYQGRTLTVVPHGMTETKLLTNLGMKPPHPIDFYYRWPARPGITPMQHQKETARFLSMHSRAYCLDDMGCGKTLSTLWAFDFLRQEGLVSKLLVVSPLSTVERTWADEVHWNFPHLRSVVLHGTKEQRRKLAKINVDVFIINHDGVKVILPELIERGFDAVVIDELAQAARNANTDRWRSYKALIEKVPIVWGATGTPIPNEPTDAWAQCKLLTPSTVPPFHSHFRDKVMRQVSEFRWVPREGALEYVHSVMQPAIRHRRDDVMDLPPVMYETRHAALTKEQARMYQEMESKLRTEANGIQINAVNEGVKAMKLVQICCIAHGTEVLSSRGWVPIQYVRDDDALWDGVEWVKHDGLLRQGRKEVVECFGVRMTRDHQVLTSEGWKFAQEILDADASERLDRASVRIPDGYSSRREHHSFWGQMRDVAVSLRLRERGGADQPKLTEEAATVSETLRMQIRHARDNAWKRNAWEIGSRRPSVQELGVYATEVFSAGRQRLQALRCAWDRGLQTVERVICCVRGGHGATPHGDNAGADRQRLALRAEQLPLGDGEATTEQHEEYCLAGHTEGKDALGRGGANVWDTPPNAAGSCSEAEVASVAGANGAAKEVAVFDIADCGPRNRFVVRGNDGVPLIVHNCGSTRAEDDVVDTPPKHRLLALREVIESAGSKVIVFVPFRAPLEMIAGLLRKAYSVEVIHGGVARQDRDRIFSAFQERKDPHILVAQPAAMSHGLTLTAASCIVWFAPTNRSDVYEQANGRITRPGQTRNQLIVHLEGTKLEQRMYERLQQKATMQGVLLGLFK